MIEHHAIGHKCNPLCLLRYAFASMTLHGNGKLVCPTLCRYLKLSVELWDHHIIPDHVLCRCSYRDEFEPADEICDSHIHLHVRKAVTSSQQHVHRTCSFLVERDTYLIPKHARVPREKATMNLVCSAISSGGLSHLPGSNLCGFSKIFSL